MRLAEVWEVNGRGNEPIALRKDVNDGELKARMKKISEISPSFANTPMG